ncbi:prephenate dehydratase [Brevibacillus reuszeri]|uniref:Prephenate dehydratase n=1 Tax=Brevibacillus reuszeri TaxID=54915 RepID=A0A0K9YYZ3_9BACL|nr:prephenate dehydratase [Brevibacillus reuszeri]KNB73919.1 prephenate dehydratase [Brevibacillus reuszeri]MED1859930.1 prephenate dehydratase [Brevibacillus reuszeri]GED71006.1 prephenate dehydratase [Brevibacillus reuszeri]
MEKKLAYLGPRGTFTEEAARALTAGQKLSLVPYPSIIEVLNAVAKEEVAFGVVPMENSIEGTVNSTLDWLIHEVDLPILAELALPITQNLLVAKREHSLPLSEITKVLSHPQAIAQSHNFLRENLPGAAIEYVNSTAFAAQMVSENPQEPWAAVGTKLNVEIYPLEFAQEQIQDYSNNYTRFVLVGQEPLDMPASSKEKTTILVNLPEDFPGALYQVLAAFAWRKVNLSRIESRPTKKALGSYYFVIDIEQKMDDVLLPGAFAEIEAIGCQVRQLGTYPFYLQQANS